MRDGEEKKGEKLTSCDRLTKFHVVEEEKEKLRLHYSFSSARLFTRKAMRQEVGAHNPDKTTNTKVFRQRKPIESVIIIWNIVPGKILQDRKGIRNC